MKKLLIIVIVGLMILGVGSTTFAAGQSSGQAMGGFQGGSGNNQGSGWGQTTDQSIEPGRKSGNTEAYSAQRQQFGRNREQVRTNTTETTRLRTQINDCSTDLKLQIQKKLQNRDSISAEEMLRYKEAIQTLNQVREQILLEQGKIQQQVDAMCQARLQGDIVAANTAMNNICTEQQLRIVVLTKVLEDLNNLLKDN